MTIYDNEKRMARDMANPVLAAYHAEFGKPALETNQLFERLSLQIYAAGLQWETIVPKMPAYRNLFFDYDVTKVAGMSEDELFDQVGNFPEVINNHKKLIATITNARAIQAIEATGTSFHDYLAGIVPGDEPFVAEMPDLLAPAEVVSKQMKKDGFTFTGPTTLRTFLHGTGFVKFPTEK
jgi:DNA-3-methyladenine glycosylase I